MDYFLIGIVILIVLNIAVSIYLYKRDDLENFQKIAQIVIVWLIPFVGAIALWIFNRSQDDNKPSGGSFGGGASDRTSQLE